MVDKFVQELKEALDADIQDRIMKEREMQSYIEEREREVAEREAAWKAELSRREVSLNYLFCFNSIFPFLLFIFQFHFSFSLHPKKKKLIFGICLLSIRVKFNLVPVKLK